MLAGSFAAHDSFPSREELTALARERGVRNANGVAVTFVPAKPKGRRKKRDDGPPYELRIHATGEVPTRGDSWHDFFNALVWAHFPMTKAALNARQIAAAPVVTEEDRKAGRVRSREQDRLAMMDEGGLIVARGVPFLFGHAVMEEAVQGRMGAQVFVLEVDAEPEVAAVDEAAARIVTQGGLASPSAPPVKLREWYR